MNFKNRDSLLVSTVPRVPQSVGHALLAVVVSWFSGTTKNKRHCRTNFYFTEVERLTAMHDSTVRCRLLTKPISADFFPHYRALELRVKKVPTVKRLSLTSIILRLFNPGKNFFWKIIYDHICHIWSNMSYVIHMYNFMKCPKIYEKLKFFIILQVHLSHVISYIIRYIF